MIEARSHSNIPDSVERKVIPLHGIGEVLAAQRQTRNSEGILMPCLNEQGEIACPLYRADKQLPCQEAITNIIDLGMLTICKQTGVEMTLIDNVQDSEIE